MLTKILLAISNFLTTEYLVYGPIAIGLLAGVVVFCHTQGGRRILDWGKLNLPPLRTMCRAALHHARHAHHGYAACRGREPAGHHRHLSAVW